MRDFNEFIMSVIIAAGRGAEVGEIERKIFTEVWAEVVASSDCE